MSRRDELLAEIEDVIAGRWSTWNNFAHDYEHGQERCAMADAQRVVMLAAAAHAYTEQTDDHNWKESWEVATRLHVRAMNERDELQRQLDELHGAPVEPVPAPRLEPIEGSEPEGTGFGKPWVPQIGVTFLANGALVRSLLDLTEGHEREGLVGMDVTGKWNHAAEDTLSIIAHPDVAEEWGRFLIAGAEAARKDAESAPPVGTQE